MDVAKIHKLYAYPDSMSRGLTKRELFAAMVLQSIMTRTDLDIDSSRRAIYAVECADDLLAALAKAGE
jgi:hypothetical protein